MVSLVDIGGATEDVSLRGEKTTVTGISGKGILIILSRFPEIRKLVANKGQDVSAESLVDLAPEVVACAIAAGCGYPGDKRAEEIAGNLGAGEQLDLLEAIFRLTFPGGVGPFVEKLGRLMDVNVHDVAASGWGQDMKSPGQLNSASQQGILPI